MAKEKDRDRRDLYEAPTRDEKYFEDIPHVVARYRCVNNNRQKNNDYIAALPVMPTDAMIQRAMTSLPTFVRKDRELPASERILLLNTLDDVFFATARHVRFVRAVLKLMNQGYAARKVERAKRETDSMQALYDRMLLGDLNLHQFREHRANQFSMSLCGASGVGKSFSMKRLLDLLPPAIYHKNSSKWQLPFLLIEMAYDGESVHTLASVIFEALDELLPGENYAHNYMQVVKMNANQRVIQALRLARKHGVGMILIDEVQNQRSMGEERTRKRVRRSDAAVNIPRNETPLVKLLITASNTARMPMCLTGTLESHSLVGRYFPRGRRMAGRGSGMWLPLEPSFNLAQGQRGEFEQAMQVLFTYQWVQSPVRLTPRMLDLFWHLTMGLPDIMVKLFSSAQEAAIIHKTETLTESLFLAVYEKEFWAVHLGLEALRSGDPDLVEAFPEIWHPTQSPKFREMWLKRRMLFRVEHHLKGAHDDAGALRQARRNTKLAEKKARRKVAEQTRAARLQNAVEDFDLDDQDLGAQAMEKLRSGDNSLAGEEPGAAADSQHQPEPEVELEE